MPRLSKYSEGLEGKRYGRTTARVLAYSRKSGTKTYSYYWICLCDCGTWHITNARILARGKARSCGCLNRDREWQITHGHSRKGQISTEFRSWEKLRQRINNPKNDWFHRYGGRGIRYCRGFDDFRHFLKTVGPRPLGRTVDRINNDGHYSCGSCPECVENRWPMNVRWATSQEQSDNKETRRASNGRFMALCPVPRELPDL